jgi:hypothetical protein
LKAFRCSAKDSPSSILRWYNFYRRNNLFTRDFDWYKFPNFSHNLFVASSLEMFNKTKLERQS